MWVFVCLFVLFVFVFFYIILNTSVKVNFIHALLGVAEVI